MEALNGIIEAISGILANLGIDTEAIMEALSPILDKIIGAIM